MFLKINNFDSFCKIHKVSCFSYDENNKNYCIYCKNENAKQYKLFSEDEINNFKEKIKVNEEIINNSDNKIYDFINKVQDLLDSIKSLVDSSQKNRKTQIQFQKEILNTYSKMEDDKNLNIQVINNVKNIMQLEINTNLNNDINKIIEESDAVVQKLLDKVKFKLGVKEENIPFKNIKFENFNNIKTLTDLKYITCIKTLKDGRLCISSYESGFVIYKKNSFEPEINIKNDASSSHDFEELENGNIAAVFRSENKIKIFEIKKNEYKEIQTIKNAHNNYIAKVKELKNKDLITCG